MTAISIGPLVFAGDRLAAVIGIASYLLVTTILGRGLRPGLMSTASWALTAGLIGARLGHVALNWASFSQEPLRLFAVWQGGFEPVSGVLSALVVSAFTVRCVRSGVSIVAAIAIGVVVWMGANELAKASLGKSAPTIALQRLDGAPMAISDARGTPAVVNLWATWCPPCRREMPLLARSAAENDSVIFLFVNQVEGPAKIKAYLQMEGLKLDTVLMDTAGQVPRHYQTAGIPVTLFLHADGTLANMHVGEISPETLQTNIAEISRQ